MPTSTGSPATKRCRRRRWHIQRQRCRGQNSKQAVDTDPSKKALAAEIDKVRSADSPGTASNARRPAAPDQPGAAGLVQLSARGVLADLQLPGRLRLLAGVRIAGQEASRAEQAHPGPPVSSRLGDPRRSCRDVLAERIAIERYRYRGARIPTPWTSVGPASSAALA